MLFENAGVTVRSVDVVQDVLEAFPRSAVRYAGETLKKFASSFCSLYFSLVMRRSSEITAP